MNTGTQKPRILEAAQTTNILRAALLYRSLGFSVLPLKGKRPVCKNWKQFQETSATPEVIREWHKQGLLQNIGLICGAVSDNHIALDLDGAAGYPAFAATFPHLAETYTVATGGGVGKHIYWRVDQLPEAVKAMDTPIGNLEMCSEGRQIVAPPSIHPTTQNPYIVEKPLDILHVEDLQEVVEWIESFKKNAQTQQTARQWQPPRNLPNSNGDINPHLTQAIGNYFTGRGYRQYGHWLHGTCIHPGNHKNGDRHPSFGYNTSTGYGFCYKCGTMLTKDICDTLGIRPEDYGGLILAAPRHTPQHDSSSKLSDSPSDDEQATTSNSSTYII